MSKDFLTYNQQMKYLRDKKEIECGQTNDKIILCRNGYFNLVNGYKEPFINGSNGCSHKYLNGTSIKEIYQVKKFDDELRMLLLKYITKVEEEVRTLVGYKFDEVNNKGKIEWYSVNAYDTSRETQKIVKVISDSFQEINRSEQKYIKHYFDKYKYVPTWILVKVIKFSTFISFVEFSKKDVKRSICDLYGIKDKNGKGDFILLKGSLHWLRKIRNSCAHNERVYGIKREGTRIKTIYDNLLAKSYVRESDQKLIDLIIYMRFYLDDKDFKKFATEIKSLLEDLQGNINPNAFNKVRGDMGIKDLGHLDKLISMKKEIKYNKF
ncbi:Abi family protein [Clostridium cadaveris]|uniref:Abi family protein n=1 Tax=Clostridium cadaveris TaxID=1529 RepID=UPI0039960E8F